MLGKYVHGARVCVEQALLQTVTVVVSNRLPRVTEAMACAHCSAQRSELYYLPPITAADLTGNLRK